MREMMVVVLLGVALTACAEGNLAGQAPAAALDVSVDPGEGADERFATLTCADVGDSGTGWLQDQGDAKAACDVVEGNADRLVDGPDTGAMCTQVYGGPETAHVTGTVNGQTVDTTFSRTNGCSISDWERFEALLGPPGAPVGIVGD